MLFLINLMMCVMTVTVAGPIQSADTVTGLMNDTLQPTRRILKGHPVGDTRPYMVYLRAAAGSKVLGSDWICGGVIIHESYILTSAACIEEAKHFYVISGTNKWIPYSDPKNECILYGANKAIWKCVPKSYVYDGDDFDNIRWMVGDIAVVKVETPFNFEKRVRGCDFVPMKVDFNNRSVDLEKSRSFGSIAGWGSTDGFVDILEDENPIPEDDTGKPTEDETKSKLRTTKNSPELLETDVQLISGKNCKQRWDSRYHFIIDEQMVCTKDTTDSDTMSSLCANREVNCKELDYSDDEKADEYDDVDDKDKEKDNTHRRMIPVPGQLPVHTAGHFYDTRRKDTVPTGGFCENDHGGPLIVGQGKTSVVIGVMSACMTKDVTGKCYGPFLFTSVYRYRNLISCAINKELGATCRRLLRSSKTPMSETFFDWSGMPGVEGVKDLTFRAQDEETTKKSRDNESRLLAPALHTNASSTTEKPITFRK